VNIGLSSKAKAGSLDNKGEKEWTSMSYSSAKLAAGLASLSVVAGFAPLSGPAAAFAPSVAGRATCVQARVHKLPQGRLVAARRPNGDLRMVDIQPQVDITTDDFVQSRQVSNDSEPYAADDGGTEPSQSQYNDDTLVSSDEEREPGDVRNFPISDQTLDCLARRGITALFPIQSSTFQEIYDGRDVLARARTGTGKTLGFALPILERLIVDKIAKGTQRRARGSKPQCIILSPTRELAVQVEREIEGLTDGGAVKVSTLCVYGGVPYQKQERELRNGVDMVVGTPGRMIDLYEKGGLDLSEIKYLVSCFHHFSFS